MRLVPVLVAVAAVAVVGLLVLAPGDEGPRREPRAHPGPRDRRREALVGRMTLDEKLGLMAGAFRDDGKVAIPGVPRLGIPPLVVADGPAGITTGVPDGATALPAPLALAAGFSPALAEAYGDVLGAEADAAGAGMLFAPVLNLVRDPRGGRAFESLGEDPALAAALAGPLVRAVQAHPVIATPKHYVANDQERWRMRASERVADAPLRELYLPPFEAALRAGAGALMAAYPAVNGAPMTASRPLLAIPRKEWGWRGAVVSDYSATRATLPALRAGLDVELPTANHYGEPLREALDAGRIAEPAIDRAAERLVGAMQRAGLVGRERDGAAPAVDSEGTAREVAKAGAVLLENRDETLPLPDDVKSIAVIGPGAEEPAMGLGSAAVQPDRGVGLAPALREALPAAAVTVVGAWRPEELPAVPASALRRLRGREYDNPSLRGSGTPRRDRSLDLDFDANGGRPWSARWRATLVAPETGEYELGTLAAGAARLALGGRLLLDGGAPGDVDWHPARPESVRVTLRARQRVPLTVDYVSPVRDPPALRVWWLTPSRLRARNRAAVRAASAAEVAVVAARDWSGEGGDRANLRLPAGQEQLIRAVAHANRRTVVVLQTGGPVDVSPWASRVPALLEGWYPGEQGGPALAEILLGRADAGGRLPVTFPRRLADAPTAPPGRYPVERPRLAYGEGLLAGYRWYDERDIRPRYPFGFGRSYTEFAYRDLAIDGTRVTFAVANQGDRPGTAVPQVYVQLPGRPLRLAGFSRTPVDAGGEARVSVALPARSLQLWRNGRWVRPEGRIAVSVRTDARTVVLSGRI